MESILTMKNITKVFPNVIANNDVSLSIKAGSIHAIIGENGAGKSTLMNILCGLHKADSGEIYLKGKLTTIDSTYDAINLGIGMVHQHFMLVPELTALENIIIGANTPKKYGLTDYSKGRGEVHKIIEKYQFPIDLNKKIYELSVGEMQRVEIIKALYRGADILILDEPTAVLIPQEIEKLFEVLRHLSSLGKTIIFISHKLKEILQISDEITVMRAGKVTGAVSKKDADEKLLASMMVGREVIFNVEKKEAETGKVVLDVEKLAALDDRKMLALKNISFNVKQGEIVGIAGVDGNGQTELIEVLTGLRKETGGKIIIDGEDLTKNSCFERRRKGLAHIPSDRMVLGINKTCSVYENLILNVYNEKPYCEHNRMNKSMLADFSKKLIKEFQISAPSHETSMGNLSGGNMQKGIVAREISSNPEILIAAKPTRGVDVGAIEFIHSEIIRLRDQQKGVLLVSTELDEILSLSDRILVMYEGEIVAEITDTNIDELEIGLYMTGSKRMEGLI